MAKQSVKSSVGDPHLLLQHGVHGPEPLSPTEKEQELKRRRDDSNFTRWIFPKKFDQGIFMKHLSASIEAGHLTNRGPATQRLEAEARRRLKLGRHVAIPACSGSAALHALLATYLMKGHDLPNGILVSAFGFPPILQGNWKQVTVTDVDPKHGGPILPPHGYPAPSVVCLVNPFGYLCDVPYYRQYCDEHGVMLWMDNAACPLTLLPDGRNVIDLADAACISLHETKVIGRGEGGLLIVLPEYQETALRAINFGYDTNVPATERPATYHLEASNWRMSDIAAAAILMNWEVNWSLIVEYMEEHDSEVVDAPPFKRGAKGSIYSCLLEPRQERPDFEVKYYYYPMLPRGRPDSVVAWRFFDEYQCRPFHPPGGPCPY